MKKIFFILSVFFVIPIFLCAYTINAGVSVDKVPKTLFGSWKVEAVLIQTNSERSFKPQSTDLWNLFRTGDVLRLENPFTGAKAEVGLKTAEGNLVVFTKTSDWDNKILKDIVTIRLEQNTFTGINDVVLETHSIFDGSLIKKETARYRIKGEKLSGNTLLK